MNIREKSFLFAIQIVKLSLALSEDHRFYRPILQQLLRCGTSIGANVEEAAAAHTKKDFLSKMHIAFKEAREANYWLRIIKEIKLGNPDKINVLLSESVALIKLLTAITKTTKKKLSE
jgi:four helix bundle protein